MTIIEAVILGLVQGFTEFLPVSSSGHLLLFSRFLGVSELSVGFELVCHLGTLTAVVIAMRKPIFEVLRKPISRSSGLIICATAVSAVIVGIISVFFKNILSGELLIYCFILTGILLLCCEFTASEKPYRKMLYPHAAVIGAAQGLAALPGLSRSGTTIAAAQLLGYNRKQSAEFSFLLSIPIIIGSSVVELIAHGIGGGIGAGAIAAAFISSFVSGIIAVRLMLKIVSRHSLDGFAIYLFLLSVFLLLNDFVFNLF